MIITQIYMSVLIIFNDILETCIYQISLLTNAFFYHVLQVFCLRERIVGNFVESKAGHFFFFWHAVRFQLRQKRKWNSFPAFKTLIEGLIPKLSPFWLYVCLCV